MVGACRRVSFFSAASFLCRHAGLIDLLLQDCRLLWLLHHHRMRIIAPDDGQNAEHNRQQKMY